MFSIRESAEMVNLETRYNPRSRVLPNVYTDITWSKANPLRGLRDNLFVNSFENCGGVGGSDKNLAGERIGTGSQRSHHFITISMYKKAHGIDRLLYTRGLR